MAQLDAFVSQFGQLGFVTRQRLVEVLKTEEGPGLSAFMEHIRALWARDMMGWERVDVAATLAEIPAAWRPTFVVAVQAVGAQALLRLRWAPDRVAAHAMRIVVHSTAKIEPKAWADWVPAVQRVCAGVEYYDAPYVINALADLPPESWGEFLTTVEKLCPENLDSHNRMQIVVMLAHSKLAAEGREKLLAACEPVRAESAFTLRSTIENFLGVS